VRLEPGLGDAWYYLGIAYDKYGDYEKATRAYREAERLGREVARPS
jgi:cytochrome c-type biogenesis protein CcmH/NrfG